jgi:hypothetical protein
MVIGVGGCDNVDWGGIDIAIVPPPAKTGPAEAAPEPDLPAGPVLFYVHRDSTGPTVIPVGRLGDSGLTPIEPGDDPTAFADRFTNALLAPGTELALFRRGRRVGNLTVEGATLPDGPVCRPLPRATGTLDLASGAGGVTEFLALPVASAPESQPSDELRPARRMEVVGDMLAERMLQDREVPVASVAAARRQLQPFPLADSPDPGFAATYLVDDTLGLGADDDGNALFVVFTPRGQEGYQPAFVGFTDYTGGKAAPRVIDFLDWDRDDHAEILLEVFGTSSSWFRAVGRDGDRWRAIFEDRCDPRTAPTDTAAPVEAEPVEARPAPRQQARRQPPPQPAFDLDSIPDIEPTIQLSNPAQTPRVGRRDTARDTVPPDTGGGR